MALVAEAAAVAPAAASAPTAPAAVAREQASASAHCTPAAPTPESPTEIVVCAKRPPSYRLDPDVMEAKRAMRRGKLKRPERLKDTSCATVGPAGCIGAGAGIDLLSGAMVLGTMAGKAMRGENVGSMFVTDPQQSEYELYLEAKRNREAREAEAAAAAQAKAKASPVVSAAAPEAAPVP